MNDYNDDLTKTPEPNLTKQLTADIEMKSLTVYSRTCNSSTL